jgi:hypothetical protein
LRGAVPYNDAVAGLASTRGVHEIPRVPAENREAFEIELQQPTNRELFRNVYERKRWVSASFQRPTSKAIEHMKRIAGDWLRGENLTPISIYQDEDDVASDPDKRRLMDGRHRLAALTQFIAGHLPALIIYEDKPCECVGKKSFHVVQWWYDKVDGRDSNLVDRTYFENEGRVCIDKMRLQGYVCYDCCQRVCSIDEGTDPRLWPFGYEEHAICHECWEEKAEQQFSVSQEREEGEISEIDSKNREFVQTKRVGGFSKDSVKIYNKVLTSENRAIFDKMKSIIFYYHKLHNEDQARKEFEQISLLSTPFTEEDQMRTLLQSSRYGMRIYEIVRPVAEFLCTCVANTDKGAYGVDIVEDALSQSKGKQLTMSVTLLMQCWYKARNYQHGEFDADKCIMWYKTNAINMVKSALDIDMEELRNDKYKYIDNAKEYLAHSMNDLRRVLVLRPDGRTVKLLQLSDIIKLVDIFSDETTLRYLSRADYIENRGQFLRCLTEKIRSGGKEKTKVKGELYVPGQKDAFEEKRKVALSIILDVDGCVLTPATTRRGVKRARA